MAVYVCLLAVVCGFSYQILMKSVLQVIICAHKDGFGRSGHVAM